MELQNEYLIIIDKKTSSPFYSLCNSIKRFNEYVEKTTKLKIKDKKLTMGEYSYCYNVKQGKVKGKEQIFFYITLKFNENEEHLDKYKNLLRTVKNSFHANDIIIETLRDDLSFYYSKLSYSLIHNVENLMRKFITYFMITNVGKNWVNESSPVQIQEALDKSKRKQYIDVLQQLDFIHLGDFLFKAYHEEDISDLFMKIQTLENDISISELQNYLPKSNWDKYFKKIVDCDDIYLKKRWEQLYDLRNKIAHTSHFTLGDYEDIKNLVGEIKEKLEKAFSNIDTIELLDEDKEQLSENIAINVNESVGNFLQAWNKLEKQLYKIAKNNGIDMKSNFLYLLKNLENKNYFDISFIERIRNIRIIRNNIVHGLDTIEIDKIQKYNLEIEKINNIILTSWKKEILDALYSLNKEATLEQIYVFIEENTDRELTSSWKSSIRKTIYNYSSDVDLYLGKEDLFIHTGKGKWKLRN